MKKTSTTFRVNLIIIRTILVTISLIFGISSCNRISDNREYSTTMKGTQFSGLPLRFVENIGQTLPEVQFHVEGAGHTVLFQSERVVFNRKHRNQASDPGSQIILEFPGSNPFPEIHGLEKQKGVTNYYTGSDPSDWHTHISSYGRIIYKGLYPGIDMTCSGDKGIFKNEFRVSEGADPKQIQFIYSGAKKIKISRKGELLIKTDVGQLVDGTPVAYQVIDGVKREVKISYRIRQGVVGFNLGSYNPSFPLIIDPEFSYVTYYSGNNETSGAGLAVDGDGHLLFGGHSMATDLPMANPVQDSNAGWEDAFVVKIDTATGDYIYATYIGGDTTDLVMDFAIDEDGNAYITGTTLSADYPVSENAFQQTSSGYQEVFLTKLDPEGMIIYSTLLGGTNRDYGYGMALNARQEVYLTGYAASSNFPLNEPIQANIGGSYDVFISKFSAGGDSLLYSSFFGGSDLEGARSIALDWDENIFLTGETASTDYPVVNAAQDTLAGIVDAFVTKLNPTGQEVVYSTYLGGAEADLAYDIVVDTAGVAYVCGGSESADFPEKSLGQAKSLKSALDVPETGVDAFITFYDVVGHVIFATITRAPWFNYYRAMTIMSGGIDPYLLVTGYLHSGLSVKAYAIRDYSEVIEVYEAVPVFDLEDETHHYYPKDIYALGELGSFALNMWTTATIPTPANGTPDPNPDCDQSQDNVIAFVLPAHIRVTIEMPDSLQFEAQLVAHIKVENLSEYVEAREVGITIEVDTGRHLQQLYIGDYPFLNQPFMLGNIPPGGSLEITAHFKVGYKDLFFLDGKEYSVKIKANARGINTNEAVAERVTELFILEVDALMDLYEYWGFRTNKSTQIDMVDIYVNDSLVVDDLHSGESRNQEIAIAGIYPRIDITNSTDPNNLDPIASYVIDLNGPGNEHLISPRNHQLILIEDSEGVIHLYHKRDVQTVSSDPSKVDLFVVHGAADIGAADIRSVDIQNHENVLGTLFDDLEPDSITGYISVNPEVFALELSNSDNSTVHNVMEADLTALAGKAISGVILPDNTTEEASAILVISGTAATTGISRETVNEGNGVTFLTSYPNPFSSAVTISYVLEETMDLEVSIYGISGQKIRTLYTGFQMKGEQYLHWDGRNESGIMTDPGMYLCVLKSGVGTVTRKITKVR